MPLVLAAITAPSSTAATAGFLKRELIEHLGVRRTATAKLRLGPPFEVSREEGLIAQVSAHGACC